MTGYLKPNFKQMSAEIRGEYRSIYCGLCHTLKKEYGHVGVLCLNYEIVTFLILVFSLKEEKKIFHGSCSITPFLRVPFIDYLSTEFINAAAISILIADCKITDNIKDQRELRWIVAKKLLYKNLKGAKYRLSLNYEQIQYFVGEFFALEKSSETEFISLLKISGKMIETMIRPVIVNCKKEWSETILQLANLIGQWIYLIDACDDWLSDTKNGNFNPINLIVDSTSVYTVVESIEVKIYNHLATLPIKHHIDLVNHMFVENLHKTSVLYR